jgi:hypothetical protein
MAVIMVNQYVAYYSVGITSEGKLAPLPVLAKYVQNKDSENMQRQHATQKIEDAAQERNMTMLLLNDIYDLDEHGSSPDIVGRWFIMHGMVRANDESSANDAILEIRMRMIQNEE